MPEEAKAAYRKYLRSEDWKGKRKEKTKEHKRCGICGGTENLDVHHLNYRSWNDVEQSDLRVLCRRCHTTAHEVMKAGKVTFRSTDHNSRFTLLKTAVKKELGLTGVNLFRTEQGNDRNA